MYGRHRIVEKEEMSLEELKDKVMQLAVISIAGTTLSFQKNGIS